MTNGGWLNESTEEARRYGLNARSAGFQPSQDARHTQVPADHIILTRRRERMELLRLIGETNDDSRYRFHLAKTEPEGGRPLDALARSEADWLEWQVYRGRAKERFLTDFVVSFAQLEGDKFLFGGVFEITGRTGEVYEVEYTDEYRDMIGRLIIQCRGENTRRTVFKPSYIFSNSRVSGIYEYRFKGEPFKSHDAVNHDFRAMEIIVRNELDDWKVALRSVSGIYLISDKATGKHYVGSAHLAKRGFGGDGRTIFTVSTGTIPI